MIFLAKVELIRRSREQLANAKKVLIKIELPLGGPFDWKSNILV
jgi:hypothetical protein